MDHGLQDIVIIGAMAIATIVIAWWTPAAAADAAAIAAGVSFLALARAIARAIDGGDEC